MTTIRPRLRVAFTLAALAAALLTLIAVRPASAHGQDGKMSLLRAAETGPLHSQIEVGLLYANDNDLAEEATVSVTLTGPDGAIVGPVPAPRTEGSRYLAEVDLPGPGAWTFEVTSQAPAAAVTGTVAIAAPAPTTVAPAPTTTAVPAGAIIVPSAGTTAEPLLTDEVDLPPAAAIVAVGLIAFALGFAGVQVVRRRSPAPAPTDA